MWLQIVTFPYPGMYFEEIDLKAHFEKHGVNGGCFSLFDPQRNTWYRYNDARCRQGFIPKSTFKIPHALIALEEGVLSDADQVIPWDGKIHEIESWNQDQNLGTAIKYSCVWFFSALTEKIDSSTYTDYLEKFRYGNRDISGPHSHFWLYGNLRISADEQVRFLQRFYTHDLGISPRTTEIVKNLILQEETEQYGIYAKTGGGPLNESQHIMWYVGFIKKGEYIYYFSMNFTCNGFTEKSAAARIKITRSVLKEMGILG